MKIIAGKHRNRIIPTLKKSDYRPSTTKLREALFSILSSGEFFSLRPIESATVLDLFAGTGSLSFEALSRGAQHITLVDNNKEHLDLANQFAKKIGEQDNIRLLVADATYLPSAQQKYTLVFMDPPYHKNYVEKSLTCLVAGNWLEPGAIIAIEASRYEDIKITDKFELLKEKIYSNNKLLILRYE
ncbi:MAG: 16S rRNA (guanine(966)-N(2))-methyltransferase RsmD [Rickettsiaceae bacterium]